MPRIDDRLSKCVFYVYMSKDDAGQGHQDSATGFFFGIPSDYDKSLLFIYAVTNRHVIKHEEMETPTLRINTHGGEFDIIETKQDQWRFHPFGSDLAICQIALSQIHDFTFLTEEFLLTKEFMDNKNVGVGDDVFMIGNFQTRGGKAKNIPAVRFGNIAQMPIEPMKNPHTSLEEESFIVEMRSTSGYSGSPVILSIPWLSNRMIRLETEENSSPKWHKPEPDYYRLLGIDWGHIRTKERLYNKDGDELPDGESVWMNSAMAGVVPSWKLAEMLYSEEEDEIRKKEDNELKLEKERSVNAVVRKE